MRMRQKDTHGLNTLGRSRWIGHEREALEARQTTTMEGEEVKLTQGHERQKNTNIIIAAY